MNLSESSPSAAAFADRILTFLRSAVAFCRQEQESIPVNEQRLLLRGKGLQNNLRRADYDIGEQEALLLCTATWGGGKRDAPGDSNESTKRGAGGERQDGEEPLQQADAQGVNSQVGCQMPDHDEKVGTPSHMPLSFSAQIMPSLGQVHKVYAPV